jgi:glycosyltransferase involved in cell wall biosynthesis
MVAKKSAKKSPAKKAATKKITAGKSRVKKAVAKKAPSMKRTALKPRAIMIVLNAVTNDSRVLKGAWYLADKGFEVMILGISPNKKIDHLNVGRAHIVRVLRKELFPVGNRYINVIRKAWLATFAEFLPTPREVTLKPMEEARRGMVQAVIDFKPDLIHAQDFSAIPVAVQAHDRILAKTGKDIPLIYDAHEFLPGQANIKRPIRRSLVAMERKAISKFHQVVTVSEMIADMVHENHRLAKRPVVVTNDPVLGAARKHKSDLRKDIGLAKSVPLMVYSGGVAPQRGIMVAVKSLPSLPKHHLAIMAPGSNAHLKELEAMAVKLGVSDRVHILGFVDNAEVTSYLKSADIGLIMNTHHVNHELSTPTKFSEYSHAGVPMVVSDVKFLSQEVRRLGIGEVFISEDVPTFVQAVKKVSANPAKYKKNFTKAFLTERSWEAQSDKYVDLYIDLLGQAPKKLASSVFKISGGELKTDRESMASFYARTIS